MTLIEAKQFTRWIAFWVSVILVVLFFAEAIFIALGGTLDDTDLSPAKRSGLRVHTDYKNGCQYLSAPKGGIMARYAPDGGHMGCIKGLATPLPAPAFDYQPRS